MARPKEFDHDQVVLKAAALFQRQGYEATSVRQLLDELELSSSSFYAAFGGKEQLLMEALAAHARIERDQLRQALEGPGQFRDKFAGLLATLIDELSSAGGVSSLTLSAAVELAGTKPQVLEFLSKYMEELVEMVTELIVLAMNRGELGRGPAPEHLSRFLLFNAFNLGFVAKVTGARDDLEGYAAVALAALDAHPNAHPTT
ncbi:MAG TPA: TetR/AcrR family transcriptional regulator [Trueperaceae bacterium]|jgi:TetR/AcrR family transcriptional repressor of nem operon|nr:TetR/AcrR family transcriptional regulator [Trueperaceae bacterium]HRQ10178.1 TetR/AcrR family transcriptional regulator [Trueperaceae bacterium]